MGDFRERAESISVAGGLRVSHSPCVAELPHPCHPNLKCHRSSLLCLGESKIGGGFSSTEILRATEENTGCGPHIVLDPDTEDVIITLLVPIIYHTPRVGWSSSIHLDEFPIDAIVSYAEMRPKVLAPSVCDTLSHLNPS